MDRLTALLSICKRKVKFWGSNVPKQLEKSVFRLERKLPVIDDRRLRKSIRINSIRTDLRSLIIGALAKPKSRFFKLFGYILNESLVGYIVDFVYPPLCAICRSPTRQMICPTCVDLLAIPDVRSRCSRCFSLLGYLRSENSVSLCPKCVHRAELPVPRAYLFEPSPISQRLESILLQDSEGSQRRTIASLLIVLWSRLNWPSPDRIVVLRSMQHDSLLFQIAEEFGGMIERPVSDEFCLQWMAPFQWKMKRKKEYSLDGQILLMIDWAGNIDLLSQAVRELRLAFPRSVHILSVFK